MNVTQEFSIFQWLTILEAAVNLSTYPITGICFYIFIKYPMFHTNFIRLIKCIFLFYLTAQSMRLIVAIDEIISKREIEGDNVTRNYLLIGGGNGVFAYLGILKLFCYVFVYATTGSVAFERVYATMKLKTYETTVSNKLTAICLAYEIMLSSVATYGVFSDRITVVAVGIFIIVGNTVVCILLWILERINKKRYYTSLTNPYQYSLSERFQLNENIKTAKIIRRVAEVVNILNIILGSFIGISYYYESELLRKYAYLMLHLFLSFYGYIFAIVGMASNPIWYQKFKHILRSASKMRVTPADSSEAQQRINLGKQLLTHTGKRMIFTIDEEREVYFKQLKNGWS